MLVPVTRLQLITPFHSSVAELSRDDQLLLLKGCALCRVTREVDLGSTRNKPEWKACKVELGVAIEVFAQNEAPSAVLQALAGDEPPAVFAVAPGQLHLVLNRRSLERCNGSVRDFRGRLGFRLAQLGLTLPPAAGAPPPARPSKRV